MLGTIFDIKEFSIYDGPGMRITVFFKGCPLRCLWCHNPEGLEREPQIMVSTASCLHCGKCEVDGCSYRYDGRCSACERCLSLCPGGFRRIAGEDYTPEQLCERIVSFSDFFGRTDPNAHTDPESVSGGVTFSGGEPLMQADFLCALLDLLPRDIHRAVQTSGFAPEETFSRVLDRVDYMFFDIKHADSETHRRLTGVPNEPILRSLRILKSSGKPFVARIPLIAGMNDSSENLRASAELLRGESGLIRVELLPYNGAAGGKYKMIGKEYMGEEFSAPEKASTDISAFEEYGIEVRIL